VLARLRQDYNMGYRFDHEQALILKLPIAVAIMLLSTQNQRERHRLPLVWGFLKWKARLDGSVSGSLSQNGDGYYPAACFSS